MATRRVFTANGPKILKTSIASQRVSQWYIRNSFFSTGNQRNDSKFDEWIPPEQPLSGDKGQSHLYVTPRMEQDDEDVDEEEALRRLEVALQKLDEEEARSKQEHHASDGTGAKGEETVDWLQTRRSVLGDDGFDMVKPSEAALKIQQASDIAVKEFTLFTKDEIAACLKALGGRDIIVVLDDPKKKRFGGAVIGMIIVTGTSTVQLRKLADALVRQLRRRKLQERGVVGAQLGAECSDDPNEGWVVVDCHNYIVHLQDERMRRALKLEALWTGRDRLYDLNIADEDEVDKYVAENPVPEGYERTVFDWDTRLRELQKNRWVSPNKPLVPKKRTRKTRKR
ncbi:predicted protein [Phaeodactylum tricornutum CCAP 1055/1]|jgi:ribosomal silencing factor RsfS|uniref:Uncharacterized protein n=2 Tax=Phaeodactylum tricornutum TaxID=2850 RepID=B7FPM4_PHATC|nr:predicted protein [Phaeodactylum tricornutum CCAP 1055/1]EEC51700.1 predicted protein [Phaeodactylum tricornutum CCAP 1055/1]|eukprot:XP_002177237.1 predicted protein [Phaeodactylum tricornutum CCAP 1055/1]